VLLVALGCGWWLKILGSKAGSTAMAGEQARLIMGITAHAPTDQTIVLWPPAARTNLPRKLAAALGVPVAV